MKKWEGNGRVTVFAHNVIPVAEERFYQILAQRDFRVVYPPYLNAVYDTQQQKRLMGSGAPGSRIPDGGIPVRPEIFDVLYNFSFRHDVILTAPEKSIIPLFRQKIIRHIS
jgi:hypothetical protein